MLNNGIPIIAEEYVPQTGSSLDDLLYALIKGPKRTKIAYLYSMLEKPFPPNRDNQKIVMEILVLDDKNKRNLVADYNYYYQQPLHIAVGSHLDGDYKNFLEQLVNRTREEKYNGPSQDEADAAKLLDEERKDGSWGDHRDQLDLVIMQKSRQFVLEVLKKYSENNKISLYLHVQVKLAGADMTSAEEDMIFGYISLIDFLEDPIKYMAFRIKRSLEDDKDLDGTLILIILCYSENGLKDVNAAFQKDNGKSIKDASLAGPNPSITRKILAVIADKKAQIGTATHPPQPTIASTAPAPAPASGS